MIWVLLQIGLTKSLIYVNSVRMFVNLVDIHEKVKVQLGVQLNQKIEVTSWNDRQYG